jgi:signal peptide peptidase SppA
MKDDCRFGHLAQRLFNTPLAIHPGKAEVIIGALADRLQLTSIETSLGTIRASGAWDKEDFDEEGETYSEPGYEVELGIAKIDIADTLVMKLGGLRPFSGMTGYDGIRQNMIAAARDPLVKAIMMDVDSPGGEVSGLFDLADTISTIDKKVKPVFAVLTESAYSAGYCLACAARRIYVPRTGGAGSIGVVAMHVDLSKAIERAGLKVTFLYDGDRKIDGAPEIPLSDEAYQRAMKDITTISGMFRSTVSQNRGLSVEKIRDMQAGTFLGADGVTAGLADEVIAPADAFQDILDRVG